MPFQKGKSGNPGGRPRIPNEVKELAQQHGPEAFSRIVELMQSEDQRLALAACTEVLNRAYGRPGVAVGEVDPDAPIIERIERVIIPAPPKRDDADEQARARGLQ